MSVMPIMFFFLFYSFVVFGAMPDWIGRVMAIEGNATAERSGEIRDLAVDSKIFESELISVGDDSKLQIQFTDGGLVDLIPHSVYRVNEYRYRVRKEKSRFAAEIIQGGLRSLSGSIAKKNPQNYEVTTPTSVIGLRGTLFDANITQEGVYFGVEKGTVEISNAAGRIVIGEEGNRRYARVVSNEAAPQELNTRPNQLNPSLFNPPKGGADLKQHVVLPGSGIPKAPVETSTPNESKAPAQSPINLPGGGTGGSGGVSIKGGC